MKILPLIILPFLALFSNDRINKFIENENHFKLIKFISENEYIEINQSGLIHISNLDTIEKIEHPLKLSEIKYKVKFDLKFYSKNQLSVYKVVDEINFNQNIDELSQFIEPVIRKEFFKAKQDSLSINNFYSTYFGSSSGEDFIRSIDIKNDNYYFVGAAHPSDFFGNSIVHGKNDRFSVLAIKTDTNFNIEWVTIIGGSNSDAAFKGFVENRSRLWIAGQSNSNDYPIFNGFQNNNLGGTADGIISTLNENGKLVF